MKALSPREDVRGAGDWNPRQSFVVPRQRAFTQTHVRTWDEHVRACGHSRGEGRRFPKFLIDPTLA